MKYKYLTMIAAVSVTDAGADTKTAAAPCQ